MKIIKATYGSKDVTKDVTKDVQSLIFNNRLTFMVSNDLFGDPNVGHFKKIIVEIDDGSLLSVNENEFLVYPKLTKERLGIFYTNNHNEKVYDAIDLSLNTIKKAAYERADVFTCVWNKIVNNPFIELTAQTKVSSHLNQVTQILQLLYFSRILNKNYKYVSFLEHDCLYPEGYFNYEDFSENCICNMNYIGLSKDGWQYKNENHKPLSQITMKFDYAIKHFESILPNALITNNGIVEPSHDNNNIGEWNSINSSVHVNHGYHFTSHYEIYSKQKSLLNDYWGDYSKYTNLFH